MKPPRFLSLVLATVLSFGSVAIPPLAIAQEETAGTMADLYQPYYEDAYAQTDDYIVMPKPNGLPSGTHYEIYNGNYPSWRLDKFKSGPLTAYAHPNGRVQVMQDEFELPEYGQDGYTIRAQVLVTYPDQSREVVTATATLVSSMASISEVNYPDSWIKPEETVSLKPSITGESPTGYNFVETEELEKLRAQGWDFKINSANGNIRATAPENHDQTVHADVSIFYKDKSNTIVSIALHPGSEPDPTPAPSPAKPITNKGSSFFGSSF